jgi:hypothetical protein
MAQDTTKGNFLTSSKAFKSLCKWAFDVCDSNGTGAINETELYAGFLLVHLNLAKYAGPAACYVSHVCVIVMILSRTLLRKLSSDAAIPH